MSATKDAASAGTPAVDAALVMSTSKDSSDSEVLSSPTTSRTTRITRQRTIVSRSRAFVLMLVLALAALHVGRQTFHNARSTSLMPFDASYFYMTKASVHDLDNNSTQQHTEEETVIGNNHFIDVKESNKSNANASTATNTTEPGAISNTTEQHQLEIPQQWEPVLRMPTLPPPLTRNTTGGLVFFLHIPKTGGFFFRNQTMSLLFLSSVALTTFTCC